MRASRLLGAAAGAALVALSMVAWPLSASAKNLAIQDVVPSDDLLYAAPEVGGDLILAGTSCGTGANATCTGAFGDPFTIKATEPANSSEAAILAWLQAQTESSDAHTPLGKTDFPDPTPNSLSNFAGPANWVYAVVKPDGFWAVYKNNGGDNNLTTDLFNFGISNVSFYLPVPAAAWLFLSGLAGLFGLRWWHREDEVAAA